MGFQNFSCGFDIKICCFYYYIHICCRNVFYSCKKFTGKLQIKERVFVA